MDLFGQILLYKNKVNTIIRVYENIYLKNKRIKVSQFLTNLNDSAIFELIVRGMDNTKKKKLVKIKFATHKLI